MGRADFPGAMGKVACRSGPAEVGAAVGAAVARVDGVAGSCTTPPVSRSATNASAAMPAAAAAPTAARTTVVARRRGGSAPAASVGIPRVPPEG